MSLIKSMYVFDDLAKREKHPHVMSMPLYRLQVRAIINVRVRTLIIKALPLTMYPEMSKAPDIISSQGRITATGQIRMSGSIL